MEKSRVKVSVARVTDGRTKTGRPFSVVEGLSGDIGLFKVYVPQEVGEKARECMEYADDTYMYVEICTDREYKVSCRVCGFEIE